MKESEVLAEVSNENQTLVAVVQQDLRVVYFIFTRKKHSKSASQSVLAG